MKMIRLKTYYIYLVLILTVIFVIYLNADKFDQFHQDERLKLPYDDEKELAKLENELDNKLMYTSTEQPKDPINCVCYELNNKTKMNKSINESQLNSIEINSIYNKYLVQKTDINSLPTIFVITPTYFRPSQMPDLTRMAQTLMLIRNVFWLVIEDSTQFNRQVRDLLIRSKLPYAHLLGPRPNNHMNRASGRGVSNRLKALKWLRQKYTNTTKQGVIYFGDDDNSYDIRLFDEIRYTEKVSVFPVGMLSKTGVSSPILNKNGIVTGFHDPFQSGRIFAVDMAGFAVNLQYFLSHPKATMPYKQGYEEDYFLRSLKIKLFELEPKAQNCTEVLVWHTKTVKNVFPTFSNVKKINSINLLTLYKNILSTKL